MRKNYIKFIGLVFFTMMQSLIVFSQKGNDLKLGDAVTESLNVIDVDNKQVSFKIPADDKYLIVYKYRWRDEGKGIDNMDSIKQLESEIIEILIQAKIKNIKVVCLSYDYGPNLAKWQEQIKTKKPFKSNSTYKVDYYNLGNNSAGDQRSKQLFSKITIIAPDGTLLRWSSSIAKFDYNTKNSTIIRAKLVTENKGKREPLSMASVYLVSIKKNDTIAGTHTNVQGDFEMYVPDKNAQYSLRIKPASNVNNMALLTRGGREISKFDLMDSGFDYRLLNADVVRLSEYEPEEDISARYKAFLESDETEMTSIQIIYYELAKKDIRPESKPIIDKVIQIMKDNPKVRVEITSHTDSQGDDATNLALSQQRATEVVKYIVAAGIKEKRLTSYGKGEIQIRNRCKNDVLCFDEEHEYNRRTEFKFIK